ncbi:MAG: hypothetical protein KA766_14065 [Piscinibacter sp.]|uniref:hypothetical protein n=1 Tax=Piscinibacter sp. TaxID=1903157 RepID=UPI0011D6770F|nr:hypothetical protein [Piscinibacter sp.]MBP5991126.1 hypothetical protein [Piscinibacter sp.]MBP6028338.1 hypothetical protein [Piscinibacter sp.]TXH61647.1 MAG: hypothetical protein E6Q93_04495 [Burkholderiaceae bacterium]
MNRNSRLLSIAFLLLGASLHPAAQAQTPVTKLPQGLTVKWLNTLTISPSSAVAGTKFTGTVKLARPAASDMQVSLGLDGAQATEGIGFVLNGVVMPPFVKVLAGQDRAAFTVTTSGSVAKIRSKTFTARAYYGSESLAASFTVNWLATR